MLNQSAQNRQSAVKEVKVHLPKTCKCCGRRIHIGETAWELKRSSYNHMQIKEDYCKDCADSQEQVLQIVDTDNNPFGIADVDPLILNGKQLSKNADDVKTSMQAEMEYLNR